MFGHLGHMGSPSKNSRNVTHLAILVDFDDHTVPSVSKSRSLQESFGYNLYSYTQEISQNGPSCFCCLLSQKLRPSRI